MDMSDHLYDTEEVNEILANKDHHIDTNRISDGYHTFGELYEHRIELFIALCNMLGEFNSAEGGYVGPGHKIWRSTKHSDGSCYDGWFILGITMTDGRQISYHLPMTYWDRFNPWPKYVIDTLDQAPEWDGHTSADVLKRLQDL